jgi:Lar family restriction alleviation protein
MADPGLLPCPFCDSEDVKLTSASSTSMPDTWYFVECQKCGARGPMVSVCDDEHPEETARRGWNDQRPR